MITASLSACDCLSHLRVSSPGLIHAYCIARTVSGCGFPHMFEEKDNARELQEYALPCQHLSPEIRFLRNLAWKYACRGMGCRNVEWFFFALAICVRKKLFRLACRVGLFNCLNEPQKKSPHSFGWDYLTPSHWLLPYNRFGDGSFRFPILAELLIKAKKWKTFSTMEKIMTTTLMRWSDTCNSFRRITPEW
jgi:hypothetical protein